MLVWGDSVFGKDALKRRPGVCLDASAEGMDAVAVQEHLSLWAEARDTDGLPGGGLTSSVQDVCRQRLDCTEQKQGERSL